MKIETNKHFIECLDVTEKLCVVVLLRFNVPIAYNETSVFFAKFNINIYKIYN